MRNPSPEAEMVLHQRLLEGDPLAYYDVFPMYMERLAKKLEGLGYDIDVARDAALEAVLAYRKQPERYDPRKVHPFTYIMGVAKHKAADRFRSVQAQAQREKKQGDVELLLRTPNDPVERMETSARVRQIVELLEKGKVLSEQDQAMLRLVLTGESSTEELAKALRLPPMSKEDRRLEVKRHRDRLMKLLERFFGKEDSDDGA
ncbi:RNA polymerase sigma-70 factor, ECF subfamily [Stigmatella aurantiaca]|uniref:RNA polymerase sigma-70 factor, ECF subfamily n=1 Tax=Stigmatella aurantiaca TaxID=41 RepID=A0A1H7YAV5_STIAU|nr:sigma-70 family RNA polymerase sigma factor [Stigmatella aurantiaca]SEM43031.1 RNA polymerase sigma-70 factor, ECF subfamily [Stigmatella aurantiaca]